MSLFGNYEQAGAGIAKNAPQKKPFFRYWEIAFRKFWKIIEVNLIMVISFLPLVAAALVIYYFAEEYTWTALILAGGLVILFAICFGGIIAGCTRVLNDFALEKPNFLLDRFFRTFRNCFKQASLLGIIDLVMTASVASSFYVYPKIIENGGSDFYYLLFIVTVSIAICVTLMSFYGYLMIVSTELSMKNILKNALALSFIAMKKNLITLLIALLVMGGFALLTYLFPLVLLLVWLFLPTGFVAFMIVFNCYPVIQKYVINPYYAQRGEVNPELADDCADEETLFEDRGGSETPIAAKPKDKKSGDTNKSAKRKGKVIS